MAVDILARVLFMEHSKPAPTIKTKRQRDHVTHHMTHVISGSSSGSSRKQCKEKRSIKSPILSYNKWEPAPAPCHQPDSPITPRHQNHVTTENHAPNAVDGGGGGGAAESVSPRSMLVGADRAVIESEVREIKQMLRSFMTKVHQRDAKDRIAQEWRLVALTLEKRLFFFVYTGDDSHLARRHLSMERSVEYAARTPAIIIQTRIMVWIEVIQIGHSNGGIQRQVFN